MGAIEDLLEWAPVKGIKLNGIAPKRMDDRGIGIIATRAIEPDEVVLEVPTACLRNIDIVPASTTKKLPTKISIHGLLAADLAIDKSDKYSVWNAVCPTLDDFSTVPLLWPTKLQELLPYGSRQILKKQQAKLAADWATVSAAFPPGGDAGNPDETAYKYAWLLVNTRTFYFTNGRLKSRSKDDHMTLQPVADLLNHTDEGGCNVAFDHEGFTIKATRAYEPDEEVHICYGRHSGDMLLVEYGFAMDTNRWDEVSLDEVLLERLSARRKERLEDVGFLGKYVLDRESVCYRTQVALRQLCCKPSEWMQFVDGVDDGEASQPAVDKLLLEILEEYDDKAEATIEEIENSKEGSPKQREMLIARWDNVRELLQTHIERLLEAAAGED